MNSNDIANIRLISHKIISSNLKTPKDVVNYMGAMQAQNFNMVKWAIGIRLPGSTEKKIEAAINDGEIIRTHLLRPTWHFVSADDIYWMLELTAPKITASLKSRHKQLELTEKIFTKSNKIIEKALTAEKHLTREELKTELEKAKIAVSENRAAHLLLRAELDGIICSGITKGKRSTYALLNERVPKKKTLNRDEALAKLAQKYFASRFPAALQDFIWWSGLSVSDAKHALEMIKSDFISEKINSQTYWLINSFSIPKNYEESANLLPAFDEFIISYKDRNAMLTFENHKKAVSNNGIFWPTIVINGKIMGTWERTIKKDKVIVDPHFFQSPNKTETELIKKASAKFGDFLNQKIEMIYH